MASDSFIGKDDEELIEVVGCFCITFFRGHPKILRHTPRWERWSQDINGYRAYRAGLNKEREGIKTDSQDSYNEALESFKKATQSEPANLRVQLHGAALLEVKKKYEEAADVYEKCRYCGPSTLRSDTD